MSGTLITDMNHVMILVINRDIVVGQHSAVVSYVDEKDHSLLKRHIEN